MAVDFAGRAAVGDECGAIFGVMVCASYHHPVPTALARVVVVIMAAFVVAITGAVAVAAAGAGASVVVTIGSVGMVVIVVEIVIVISGLVCLFLAVVSHTARFALFLAFAKATMVVDVTHGSFI